MKKTTFVIIMFIAITLLFTGCANYSFEDKSVEATVIECKEGTFLPDEEYLNQANICLGFGKLEMYEYFMILANANGSYTYRVTVEYEGHIVTVTRHDEYEIGSKITVEARLGFTNGELVSFECK